ncbi:transcription antitermination factor NusB [Candidatus Gottesmanbacteria bacterium]|nr:transcription antitermination factor NusB [Candidatus Gottesmanbacteria bacterium]
MKTSRDPRHQKRRSIVQKLFSYSFDQTQTDENISDILSKLSEIDKKITLAAPEWPIDKIAKIDLAVLRNAIYELTRESPEPEKVIIDEAVELSKEFGNDKSSSFINGVLGTIVKKTL